MLYASPRPSRQWSDRRILVLVALSTLIISVIWRIPEEASYIGARIGELLLALTLALATTYVLRPLVRMLMRFTGDTYRGRNLAVLLSFLIVALGIYLIFLVGFRPVEQDIRGLVKNFWPKNSDQQQLLLQQWQNTVQQALNPYKAFLPEEVLTDPGYFPGQISKIGSNIWEWTRHQAGHLGFIVELLLVPVLAFYFLADGAAIRREARLLVPQSWRPRLSRMGEHFDRVLDAYVVGQAWMCVIAWIFTTLLLMLLHVPYALTLGLLAGLTRAVPVIGPMLGGVPLLLVCFFYTRSAETTLILATGFTAMHFLESKVLLPKIVGHHVDLHPVSVILALLLGMEFFGFIGVFLAVPIAAVIKIVLVEYHESQAQKRLASNTQTIAVVRTNGGTAQVVKTTEIVEANGHTSPVVAPQDVELQ
jgi:predicted PurR-regulated permease PerM